MKENFILKQECYDIIGCCMEVHKTLGSGFLEAVYHEALTIELNSKNIPFQNEVDLQIDYKGTVLKKKYKADLICFDSIIIEIKAV